MSQCGSLVPSEIFLSHAVPRDYGGVSQSGVGQLARILQSRENMNPVY